MISSKTILSWITGFFAVFVVVFFALYLLLHNKLLPSFSSDINIKTGISNGTHNYFKMTSPQEVQIPTLHVGRARYDNQRILRIYDFYFTGSQWESLVEKYDICFATQASLERMYWIPYILDRWTGPLSIAIQLVSEDEWLIFNLYTSYLTKCHSAFKNQVAMHLAVPASLPALKIDDDLLSQWNGISVEEISEKGEACPEPKQYLNYLMVKLPTKDLKKLAYKEIYPQNHMRNIGRKGCGTHWTFSADVDIIPVDGMADMLQQFYNNQKINGQPCTKCAYVIPTFELNYTFQFPENKKKLLDLCEIGVAQPYHTNFPPAHAATEYKLWTSDYQDNQTIIISHQINETKLDHYEPFYISSDNIAPFDERFLGYGSTRRSQFKAAHTAGWNFSVLNPVFSIHWGFSSMEYGHMNIPRKADLENLFV